MPQESRWPSPHQTIPVTFARTDAAATERHVVSALTSAITEQYVARQLRTVMMAASGWTQVDQEPLRPIALRSFQRIAFLRRG